jgi:hypothetical protein
MTPEVTPVPTWAIVVRITAHLLTCGLQLQLSWGQSYRPREHIQDFRHVHPSRFGIRTCATPRMHDPNRPLSVPKMFDRSIVFKNRPPSIPKMFEANRSLVSRTVHLIANIRKIDHFSPKLNRSKRRCCGVDNARQAFNFCLEKGARTNQADMTHIIPAHCRCTCRHWSTQNELMM